jgi:predicted dehydrogenase
MRNSTQSAGHAAAANLDYEMWTGPAPMRPYNRLTHPGSWRLFMEYCNGIVGDMCIHMFDMTRWMLDLGWPKRISSSGGILVQKEAKANTTDTQTRHLRVRRFESGLATPHLGLPARSQVSVGRDLLWREGNAEGERQRLRFHPEGKGGQPGTPRCHL